VPSDVAVHPPGAAPPATGAPWTRWLERALIAAAVAAGAIQTSWVETGYTAVGFPLDDAWIHLQFARNVAEGHGFSFNPGVPSSGSTAPLWTLVLAVPLAFGAGPVAAAKTLGLACVLAAALAAGSLTRHLTASRMAGAFAGIAVALTPRMVWAGLSGMEVGLYTALSTLSVLAYARTARTGRTGLGWGLLAGLAGWARPETFVIGPVLALGWMLSDGRVPATRRLVRGWWQPIAAWTLLLGAFVAFNVALGGNPMPNTYYAKAYGMGTVLGIAAGHWSDALWDAVRFPFRFLDDSVRWQAEQGMWLFGAAVPGVLAALGRLGRPAPPAGPAILGILLAAPAIKGLVAPEPVLLVHDGRYIGHLLVLGIVVCALGFDALRRMVRPGWLVVALATGALVQIGAATARGAATYAAEVRNINDLQVRTARWIAAHTSPDARIATNDIGAIGFFGRRFILDTEGLVSPEAIWPKRMHRHLEFLEASKPDVLVIFPNWYPKVAARTDLFDEVARVSAEKVIAGGESLVIYRTPWTRPGRLRVPERPPASATPSPDAGAAGPAAQPPDRAASGVSP
jgi:hypothetical protein